MSEEVCNIYPGTNIAKASSVAEVQKVKSKVFLLCESSRIVPSHLTDLYQRTAVGMDKDQQKQVANLLSKYCSIFSENDDDIGRRRCMNR